MIKLKHLSIKTKFPHWQQNTTENLPISPQLQTILGNLVKNEYGTPSKEDFALEGCKEGLFRGGGGTLYFVNKQIL